MNAHTSIYRDLDARTPQRADGSLFGGDYRQAVGRAVELTVESLLAHAVAYDHWVFAYSGGKDSTTAVTLCVSLIEMGVLPRPKSITVMLADTRQELPPLQAAALRVMDRLRDLGIRVEVVLPPIDDRYMVYMLGRGVPPPSNTFRWCTPKIKVEPMTAAIQAYLAKLDGRVLTITGVREGESQERDDRIVASCSRDGSECGQGWFQRDLPGKATDTLAPLLHWRVCNIWDWLRIFAPMREFGAWPTEMIADAYGGDLAEEKNARTGCIGCPLASRDVALEAVVDMPAWDHLAPLKRLKPLYRQLKLPEHRKRQPGWQRRKDGSLQSNQQRMGPLTFEARLMALDTILGIQRECTEAGERLGRPGINLINAEEEARIRELIASKTWPQGWDGSEPIATVPLDVISSDGIVQPLIFRELVGE